MAAISANAQFYKGFGIKAGTSIANQYTSFPDNSTRIGQESDYNEYNKYKFGFTIGVFKEMTIIHNLKAQIGINYARKGYLEKFVTTDGFGNLIENPWYFHFNYDFITTELYAKYDFLSGRIRPYVLAGLRLDFYLSRHEFLRKNGTDIDINTFDPVTNNKIFGASIGAGVDYYVSRLFSVFLEGTYNPDFTNIKEYQNSYSIRGQSFDIRTGIKF